MVDPLYPCFDEWEFPAIGAVGEKNRPPKMNVGAVVVGACSAAEGEQISVAEGARVPPKTGEGKGACSAGSGEEIPKGGAVQGLSGGAADAGLETRAGDLETFPLLPTPPVTRSGPMVPVVEVEGTAPISSAGAIDGFVGATVAAVGACGSTKNGSISGGAEIAVGGSTTQGAQGVEKTRKKASWSAICGGSLKPTSDLSLRFIQPALVDGIKTAICPISEKASNSERWKNTIVGYVVGRRPNFLQLKRILERQWRPTGLFEVFSRENGFFYFKFGEPTDCNRVLEDGPWYFESRLIVLKKWRSGMAIERDMLDKIPVWIRLPDLPVDWWSIESISRIASIIGNPLYVDGPTGKGDRIAYARCCVEVGLEDDLPNSVKLREEGDDAVTITQAVTYDWKPSVCPKCKAFGHSEARCPMTLNQNLYGTRGKKVWRAKGPGGSYTQNGRRGPTPVVDKVADVIKASGSRFAPLQVDEGNDTDANSAGIVANAHVDAGDNNLHAENDVVSALVHAENDAVPAHVHAEIVVSTHTNSAHSQEIVDVADLYVGNVEESSFAAGNPAPKVAEIVEELIAKHVDIAEVVAGKLDKEVARSVDENASRKLVGKGAENVARNTVGKVDIAANVDVNLASKVVEKVAGNMERNVEAEADSETARKEDSTKIVLEEGIETTDEEESEDELEGTYSKSKQHLVSPIVQKLPPNACMANPLYLAMLEEENYAHPARDRDRKKEKQKLKDKYGQFRTGFLDGRNTRSKGKATMEIPLDRLRP